MGLPRGVEVIYLRDPPDGNGPSWRWEGTTLTEPLMTVADVARYLGKPKSWIYDNHGSQGARIPSRKVGQSLRFRRVEVDAWVDGAAG